MNEYLLHIFIPMIISNISHILIVKKNLLSSLTIPISTKLFGQNKTWRGFLLLPFLNGILCGLVNLFYPIFEMTNALIIGAILGLVYMIFELPNSWLKRRLGIAAGEKAQKNAIGFMILDKVDSSAGVSLACHFLLQLTWLDTLYLFFLAVFTHVFFSWFLVILGVKKRF